MFTLGRTLFTELTEPITDRSEIFWSSELIVGRPPTMLIEYLEGLLKAAGCGKQEEKEREVFKWEGYIQQRTFQLH